MAITTIIRRRTPKQILVEHGLDVSTITVGPGVVETFV